MSVAVRSFLSVLARPGAMRTNGLLSTYSPTPCGLATFSAALARAPEANGAAVGVVRVVDGPPSSDPRVMAELDNGVPASLREATAALNGCDAAIVQHEYGLYGGTDGDEILDILRSLTVPSIVVAHGLAVEGTFRAHQVPLLVDPEHPEHVEQLEAWMKSYKPEELFDEDGRLVAELAELAPEGERRMGANPHPNGGLLLRDLRMPASTPTA